MSEPTIFSLIPSFLQFWKSSFSLGCTVLLVLLLVHWKQILSCFTLLLSLKTTFTFQLLRQRCCSKDPVELGNFMLTKGWCSFYTTGETCVHHLEFDVVTMGTEIRALPIGHVPIVPTALSKNLSGPMSISHMQGTPKTGYVTVCDMLWILSACWCFRNVMLDQL